MCGKGIKMLRAPSGKEDSIFTGYVNDIEEDLVKQKIILWLRQKFPELQPGSYNISIDEELLSQIIKNF
jgi:hypothetical protein